MDGEAQNELFGHPIIDPAHDYSTLLTSSPSGKNIPKVVLVKTLPTEGSSQSVLTTAANSAPAATATNSNTVMVFKLPAKPKVTPTKPVKLALTTSSPVPIKPKSVFTAPKMSTTTQLLQVLAAIQQQPVKIPSANVSPSSSKPGLSIPPPITTSSLQVCFLVAWSEICIELGKEQFCTPGGLTIDTRRHCSIKILSRDQLDHLVVFTSLKVTCMSVLFALLFIPTFLYILHPSSFPLYTFLIGCL